MSKGYTATYMRKLLRGHKAPLIERIEQLEAHVSNLQEQRNGLKAQLRTANELIAALEQKDE